MSAWLPGGGAQWGGKHRTWSRFPGKEQTLTLIGGAV